jgi:putative NADH-flavin reductase
MRIAVVGATGHTGRQVVEQALARGHVVTALARRPDSIPLEDENLTPVAADVLRPGDWMNALRETDAVVSTLGIGTSRQPTRLYSVGVANVLQAMSENRVGKLAVISAAPVASRDAQPFLERRILMPMLDRVFGATYQDMRRMETLLEQSEVDWISLRPPRLINKAPTGRYRIDARRPLSRSRSITVGDLATALLDSLSRADLYRRAAYVAN